uniref:Uncharacterized protein n=1 Tax=Trypanosoma vivax (strain Y486) TaxID=1055687 RepID=G0UAF0_TRYVY|nr:conserved hypothetical protein [Trypanosoma vivax Y486]
MLSGMWLLTDLDGTLVSTPHSAHGKYLPLTMSPCLQQVQRWLANGGSICVITTANGRVFQQLCYSLQRVLRRGKNDVTVRTGSGDHAGAACKKDAPAGSNAPAEGECGELLLSLCTGAVLYRCCSSGVEFISDYVRSTHSATKDSVKIAQLYGLKHNRAFYKPAAVDDNGQVVGEAYVQGTCFSRKVCEKLVALLEVIYLRMIKDIIEQRNNDVNAAIAGMSLRYRRLWGAFREYLDQLYAARKNGLPSSSASKVVDAGSTESDEATWKFNYVKSRRGMIRAMGLICVEVADCSMQRMSTAPLTFNATQSCVDGGSNKECDAEERSAIKALALHVVGDDTDPSCNFVRVVSHLLGTGMKKGRGFLSTLVAMRRKVGCGLFSSGGCHDVAQVIALGIPMKLYRRYFQEEQLRSCVLLGVNAVPQPNSVVFSKLGVCKSTVMRYLMEKKTGAELQGVVNVSRAVALGDNPHTTDYEMTVNPQLPFISVEDAEQRRERHALISSLTCSQDHPQNKKFNGEGCQASSKFRQRGHLMDDRRMKNIYYVGHQEHGTAAFLKALMDILKVPQDLPSKQSKWVAIDSTVFSKAVVEASVRASIALGNASSHM